MDVIMVSSFQIVKNRISGQEIVRTFFGFQMFLRVF